MIDNKTFWNLKSRLTRAKNTKDPRKILAETQHALEIFERDGFPDAWHTWKIAAYDASLAIARETGSWPVDGYRRW